MRNGALREGKDHGTNLLATAGPSYVYGYALSALRTNAYPFRGNGKLRVGFHEVQNNWDLRASAEDKESRLGDWERPTF